MSTALLAVIAVILCILFRILNVNSQPLKPSVYCKDLNFLETILKIAPILQEPYTPTRLWGFSGHVQTIVHSIIGRVKCPWPLGERVYLSLKDGATLTYDLYQPLDTSMSRDEEDDFTLAICPGIGNTSESVYIRTFVHYAQCHGYRCAVLNHVGALSSVRVTSPRIFTYGHTGDYMEMINNIAERHPSTKIVSIGFSLGGNLVTKYMGETKCLKPANIIGGISVCQGYCATEGTKYLLNWQNFRRCYLYVMTENMKSIILRHRHVLLSDETKQRCGLNENDIIAAATLPELDEAYTRRVHNFNSVSEMYAWSSCINYLSGITIPMVFINAKDDPIVPEPLLEPIRMHASSNDKSLYLEVGHGGHLGFYEGGLMYPNPVTWLDRSLVALVGGLAYVHANNTKPAPIPPPMPTLESVSPVKCLKCSKNKQPRHQKCTLISQM
ncbi:abhydrolase domain-containing protein 2 [Ischnura elegans]|uniref:abhydrolase domain-containing protein 2 n=1 Tax=Ischnura elegans TaxID=197161 RepID=UPI001ED894F2|nr:abhydrolase domain-containing protein 2 [Ischnura elegans]